MMKKTPRLGITIVLLLLGWFVVLYVIAGYSKSLPLLDPPESPKEEEVAPPPLKIEPLASILAANIARDLRYLASPELEGRMSGKRGNVKAATFIKERLESLGYQTAYQGFSIRRMNPGPKNEIGDDFTKNIIAWRDGSDPKLKNEIVVAGAHMDHIGYGPAMSRSPNSRRVHPGADDNASGTAALLAIAEAFSHMKQAPARTIVFQFYSGEEMGLIGSRYYCNNPIFPLENPDIRNHVFMLNMDMVGYLNNRNRMHALANAGSSLNISRILNRLSDKYKFSKSITSRGAGGSDHASWYNKRVPIVFLHTGSHQFYHTPSDTADRIDYDGVRDVAKFAFEVIREVANSQIRPTFDVADFRPMSYTHDHGIMNFDDAGPIE